MRTFALANALQCQVPGQNDMLYEKDCHSIQSRTLSDRMSSAVSLFLTRMAESREQGDITLKCEGEDIKANSFVLQNRYDRIIGIIIWASPFLMVWRWRDTVFHQVWILQDSCSFQYCDTEPHKGHRGEWVSSPCAWSGRQLHVWDWPPRPLLHGWCGKSSDNAQCV